MTKNLISQSSDGSGMEKVGFGRVRLYPNFQMSCQVRVFRVCTGKVGFGREMKFRVLGNLLTFTN